MKFIINFLCYGLGIMWLILGLVGVYDPNIFAKNDIVSLNVVIQSEAGASEIRALFENLEFDDNVAMTQGFRSDYEYHILDLEISSLVFGFLDILAF